MSFDQIVGKGQSNRINCFFDNGTAPLFLKDPYTTPDSELPIVQAYSGISRNQRKKNKAWAFDPRLTRQRMAAAQKILSEKLNQSELRDNTSLMENIMESLRGEYIPRSQTHFDIPGSSESIESAQTQDNNALVTVPPVSVGKWADVADEEECYEEEEENLLDVEAKMKEDVITEAVKEIENIETAAKTVRKEWVQKEKPKIPRKTSYSPPGGRKHGRRRNLSYSPQHNSPKNLTEFSDIKEVEDAVKASFYENNVNLSREFRDDLIRLYNEFGFMTQEMITMYLAGIKKERQISLSSKQENIITQLANTAAAFGRHLDTFQKNITIQNEMTASVIATANRQKKDFYASPAPQKNVHISSVVNPPPVREAPKKQETRALTVPIRQPTVEVERPKSAQTGIVIREPEVHDANPVKKKEENIQGKGKGLAKEYESQDIFDIALGAMDHISFPVEHIPEAVLLKVINIMGIDYWKLIKQAEESDEMGKYCNDLTNLAISMME